QVGDIEERAHHLALAATRPDESVAAELDRAAARARARGAPETAAEPQERAVALTPGAAGDAAERRGPAAAEDVVHAAAHARAGARSRGSGAARAGRVPALPDRRLSLLLYRSIRARPLALLPTTRLPARTRAGGRPAASPRHHVLAGVPCGRAAGGAQADRGGARGRVADRERNDDCDVARVRGSGRGPRRPDRPLPRTACRGAGDEQPHRLRHRGRLVVCGARLPRAL